jgi:hypothetical protein
MKKPEDVKQSEDFSRYEDFSLHIEQFAPGELDEALETMGIVLESVVPAKRSLRRIEEAAAQQPEVDAFPPNTAKEMKLKPLAPGIPGFPGVPGPVPVPGTPGSPGAPGFPGTESHADIKIFVCRQGKCDFVIVHRKIVIPAGDTLTIRWNNRWCKVIVEAQLGIVIVQAKRRDLFITPLNGTARVQSIRPPCPVVD